MKKTINIRNLIIIILCITIIFMGVGFVYLSAVLESKNKEEHTLNVEISKIEAETPIKGSLNEPIGKKQLTNNNKTVNFEFTLFSPYDELTYIITIRNNGTLKAKIEDIITCPNFLEDEKAKYSIHPITINHNTLKDKVLEPDEELQIKLVVSYSPLANRGQITIPYQMTILATTTNK